MNTAINLALCLQQYNGTSFMRNTDQGMMQTCDVDDLYPTHTVYELEAICAHDQRAYDPAMAYDCYAYVYAQQAQQMGVVMVANKNTLFVTFVGGVTQFEVHVY